MEEFEPCEQCGKNDWKLKFEADYYHPTTEEGRKKWMGAWGIKWYECKNCRYDKNEENEENNL